MNLESIKSKALSALVENNKSEDNKMLTGEKDLLIPKEQLIEKVKAINPAYLEVMEMEAKIFIGQGLFRGFFNIDGNIYFSIPDWDKFISAVDAFYVACYVPESEGEE